MADLVKFQNQQYSLDERRKRLFCGKRNQRLCRGRHRRKAAYEQDGLLERRAGIPECETKTFGAFLLKGGLKKDWSVISISAKQKEEPF